MIIRTSPTYRREKPCFEQKLKIGIDASRALRKIKTGTEYYNKQIILNLSKIDSKNDYILYSQNEPINDLAKLPTNFKWRIMPFFRGWTLLRLSLEMKKNPPDVLFIPAHTLPLIVPKKSVVMIHDLNFMKNPKLYPLWQKLYHNFVIGRDTKKASHFLVPSNYTKNDLIKLLNIPEKKITVIYHGFDIDLYKSMRQNHHISKKFQPYIFYLGRLEAKKNLVNLVKAFDNLQNYGLQSTKLILAGKPGHRYKEIEKEIEDRGLRKKIIELGYVKEKDLPFWFSNAVALVFPSFLEGFGLPIIEAQACGCPVLAADSSSLPEIAGDCALYFNPKDEKDMAKKISEVLKNENLRQDLIKKGFTNIRRFSWKNSAEKTLKVLESV